MNVEGLAAYLLNAAWQAPVVALTALLVARFAGLAPRGRHRVWLAALAAAAVLPAVSLDSLLQAAPTVMRVAPDAVVAAPPRLAVEAPDAAPLFAIAPWTAWAMVAAAGAFALLLFTRLTIAARAARRLVAGAAPVALPVEVRRAVETLAARHGRKAPPVLATAAVEGPAVVGVLRPVILIPSDFDASPEDLRAALLHETAHVLRHDYAMNLVCEILTLPVAWHPAVAGLKAGVRRSRELACDAMAAAAMTSQKAYAQSLLSLARNLSHGGASVRRISTQPALAVGLIGRGDLEDRLMHLLTPRDAEGVLVKTARACGLTVLSASALGAAALLHVTPVFAAQPAAPRAPAAPPEVAAVPAAPATPAPPAAPKAGARKGVVLRKDGVIIEAGQTGRRHSWTAADGTPMTVVTQDEFEPTAEQKREWERYAAEGQAKAEKVEAMVNSPEFKARIARAEEAGKRAEAYVNSPEFKAKVERAKEAGKRAEAMVNSPEFKARIEKAKAAGDAARALTHSPEFRAAMALAQSQAAAAAEAALNTPEFRRQMEELDRLGPEIDREINRAVERELSRDPS